MSNGCAPTTLTVDQINIRIKPKTDFSFRPTICINDTVCFDNRTIQGYSGNSCSEYTEFLWDFGDGENSTDKNPCHRYKSSGTFKVKLVASNNTCGSDSIIKTITVLPISPPPTTLTISYCVGQSASPLTANGVNLLWYTTLTGGVGSSNAPTPSTITSGTFTYYVTQTLPNNCESPRVPLIVTVNPIPAPPSVTSPINLCQGQIASPLTASGTGLLWYTNPTGGVGSTNAPTPSTSNTGIYTYYVSQTVNGCESPRAPILVQVGTVPVVPIVVSPVTYCQNQTAIPLTASGSNLLWYTTSTGGTGSTVAPTPSTVNPGTTLYYVSQSNNCGESPRATISVNIIAAPYASISYGNSAFCNDPGANPVPVKITGDTGGSFSISPSSGLPINSSTGIISPANATVGTYIITYKVKGLNGCQDLSTTTSVSVTATPSAVVSYPAICSSDSPVSPTLTGTINGSFSSSPGGLTIDPATGIITPSTSNPGTYTVTYTITPQLPCPGFVYNRFSRYHSCTISSYQLFANSTL